MIGEKKYYLTCNGPWDKGVYQNFDYFCAVLEMAMATWCRKVGRLGLYLGDGSPTLLDPRFADNIL